MDETQHLLGCGGGAFTHRLDNRFGIGPANSGFLRYPSPQEMYFFVFDRFPMPLLRVYPFILGHFSG